MRVFCPNCQEPVTISDDVAGKATFCPLCKAAFTAPTLFSSPAPPTAAPNPSAYTALPPPTTPSPAPLPETRVRETAPPPSASVPPMYTPPPGGYTKSFGFSISPEIVQWVAPAALVLSVLMTFFSWNGAYPGGYAVYTQGAWGALFGSFSTDPVGDKVLNLDAEKPPEGQTRLSKLVGSNLLMLLYLPLLLLAAVLAVLFTIYPMLNLKLPPSLEQYLPWRMALVAGAALLLTLMLMYQCLRGFGLENALEERARSAMTEKKPDRPTDEELKKFEIGAGAAEGMLNIRHTFALKLAFLCNAIAVFSAAAVFAMNRQGAPRQWPRLELLW